jgi:serine/threonine protein phosphatase 1
LLYRICEAMGAALKFPFMKFPRGRQVDNRPRVPDGARVYAIGDIHGRADLLERLLAAVDREQLQAPARISIVFVGDYVDRGPESARVIELVATAFPKVTTALRGNHEEMFMRFLGDSTVLGDWRRYGGLETLHSYGIDVSQVMRGDGFDVARASLDRVLPAHHRAFLEATTASVSIGDYFFCHAGVRPGVPLEQQIADDLYRIREPFLSYRGTFGRVVVHGHTPVESPDVRANRINIDTGAFATSRLTCLVLEGDQIRFLVANRAKVEVIPDQSRG